MPSEQPDTQIGLIECPPKTFEPTNLLPLGSATPLIIMSLGLLKSGLDRMKYLSQWIDNALHNVKLERRKEEYDMEIEIKKSNDRIKQLKTKKMQPRMRQRMRKQTYKMRKRKRRKKLEDLKTKVGKKLNEAQKVEDGLKKRLQVVEDKLKDSKRKALGSPSSITHGELDHAIVKNDWIRDILKKCHTLRLDV